MSVAPQMQQREEGFMRKTIPETDPLDLRTRLRSEANMPELDMSPSQSSSVPMLLTMANGKPPAYHGIANRKLNFETSSRVCHGEILPYAHLSL